MYKTGLVVFATLAIFIGLTPSASSQAPPSDGQVVRVSRGPLNIKYTQLFDYDGSSNLIYRGTAASNQPKFSWTTALTTLTSIVDSSNTSTVTTSTAHGLAVNNEVTIVGVTTDTDLNGVYRIQTVGSATTFTITTASVSDATYNASGIELSTTAPRSTAAIWTIEAFTYTGTNLIKLQTTKTWSAIWDNRAAVSVAYN